jgi:phage/plasmid-associated DNA primase
MLVLYSKEHQIGKSTLLDILNLILTTANTNMAKNLKDLFGERGCPQAIGKKINWMEEMVKSADEFLSIRENMKSSITDDMTTSRALYKEVIQYRNAHEYIASTNNLIAILQDRMTILDVSNVKQNDRQFYGKLRSSLTQDVINKFVTYLSQYQSSMPMTPLVTEIQKTMYKNSREPFEHFVDILHESYNDELEQFEHAEKKYIYSLQKDTYDYYKRFCVDNNYKAMSNKAFNSKLLISDSRVESKRINSIRDNKRVYIYIWHKDFLENPHYK